MEWDAVIRLLSSLGVEVIYNKGSRVRFRFNGLTAFLDKPHPRRELKRYQVVAIRDFLNDTGICLPE
ncbi:MAG: type II toxin-antitoxin system HicA family toxin [Chloroflexi bacterium]|nr:type II toxin-antitoxin system HicA family toxin [Chloroflexota bacterium]